MKSIEDVRKKVMELGLLINAPKNILYVHERNDSGYCLESHENEYHYILNERGQELDRFTTKNFDELLYKIFNHITSSMAFSYELANRVSNQDSRRIAFAKKIELTTAISESWREKIEQEVARILQNSPYDDFSYVRAELCKKLMDQGLSGEQAYEKSCEKFPLPK